jgi:hypothetical protein
VTDYGQFPKIQIVTVEQLFGPSNPLHLPWQDTSVFKKAKREKTEKQSELDCKRTTTSFETSLRNNKPRPYGRGFTPLDRISTSRFGVGA